MSKYIIQSVQFDEDGAYTVTYLDKTDALRRRGALMKSCAVTVAPGAGELYTELHQALKAVYEVLDDATEAYQNEPAYVPEDEDEDEDDEEDKGMGWA